MCTLNCIFMSKEDLQPLQPQLCKPLRVDIRLPAIDIVLL
jgi:hypothetical protein